MKILTLFEQIRVDFLQLIFKYKVVFKLAFLWTFFSFVNNESSKKTFYIPFVYGPGEGGETKFGHKKVSAN